MLKNPLVIMGLLVVAAISYYLYGYFKVPAGVQAQGDSEELIAWIALVTAIVSLIGSIVGLVTAIIEKLRP